MGKEQQLKDLQTLQNVGLATAERLYAIGVKSPAQMKRSNPEKIYEKLKKQEGGKLDKCVLYQMRGAVLDMPWPECKNLK